MLRLRSTAGQVAAEYAGVLLLVAVIVAALIGSQLHTQIAVEAQRAICKIAGSSECGAPGVPRADASSEDPGEPDRAVYDDECKNDLPTRSTTTSATSSSTTPTRSAATPTTTPAPS